MLRKITRYLFRYKEPTYRLYWPERVTLSWLEYHMAGVISSVKIRYINPLLLEKFGQWRENISSQMQRFL